MYISITKNFSLLAFALFTLSGTSILSAQSIVIPDVRVEENARWVDVPIYINAPDSSAALQFSILWPVLKLRLDTVKFSTPLQDGNFSTIFSRPADGEVRVLVIPIPGALDIFPFSEDSAAVVLSFELLSDFKGSADLRFNPNFSSGFSDIFANYIPATEQSGSVYSDEVTSSQNITPSAANIKVYPNPAKSTLQIEGLPDDYRQSEVYIMDKIGRRLWSSKLMDTTISLPEVLPNGLYWLVINLKEGACSKPIVILR